MTKCLQLRCKYFLCSFTRLSLWSLLFLAIWNSLWLCVANWIYCAYFLLLLLFLFTTTSHRHHFSSQNKTSCEFCKAGKGMAPSAGCSLPAYIILLPDSGMIDRKLLFRTHGAWGEFPTLFSNFDSGCPCTSVQPFFVCVFWTNATLY